MMGDLWYDVIYCASQYRKNRVNKKIKKSSGTPWISKYRPQPQALHGILSP
jgi:hypothetical protein